MQKQRSTAKLWETVKVADRTRRTVKFSPAWSDVHILLFIDILCFCVHSTKLKLLVYNHYAGYLQLCIWKKQISRVHNVAGLLCLQYVMRNVTSHDKSLCTSTLAISAVCVQCTIWLFSVVPWCPDLPVRCPGIYNPHRIRSFFNHFTRKVSFGATISHWTHSKYEHVGTWKVPVLA